MSPSSNLSDRRSRRIGARPLSILGCLYLFASAGFLGSCGGPSVPESKNVLLIVVDTLRPDHLGCYDETRETSPNIDALAATGTRFADAYSVSSWTIPSVGTILSGLYPSNHGATLVESTFPEEIVTLPEILSREGYRTAGVVSNILLTDAFNFDQGFAQYESAGRGSEPYLRISTPAVTDQAESFLEDFAHEDRPFFLFVHYFDPHYRYQAHEGLGPPEPGGRLGEDLTMEDLQALAGELTEAEVESLRDLYGGEIRFTDEGIGRLVGSLDRLDLAENTIVIFTSDHGEEFLTHGGVGHGTTVYQDQVLVPLIVDIPWLEQGDVVDSPVSLVSLTPTILDLIGLKPAWIPFQGQSLAPTVLEGLPPSRDVIYLELGFDHLDAFKNGIVAGRHKLIRDDRSGVLELYDLAADPDEQTDLAERQPDLVASLSPVLDRQIALARSSAAERGAAITLSPEQIEKLRSLGYIGGR